jgi:glycosyltransferase involved in cell wall biosynthesis
MRILIVVHYFLPRHLAGTELYTFRLAQELQKEHEVALFYAELDGRARSYSVRTGEYKGIPFTEVVNNHSYWSFRSTYANSRIDTVLASVLDSYRPDVVHIQHLANLSLGLITLLQRRHIPIVYTLHDYWLTCPRDGLRMQKSGTLCFRVIPEQCASCMATDIWSISPVGRLQRRLQPLWTQRPATPTVPGLLPPGVQVQTWEIDGDSRPIYAAQLPYRLRVRRRLRTPTGHETEVTVRFFFALHPIAYRSRNDGGVFKVFANGQEVFSRYLCPSRREKDRGWIEDHIVVQARKRLLLEFAAGLGPGRDPQHCIGAWGGITLRGAIIKERGERIQLWWEQGKRKVSHSLATLNEWCSLRAISRRIATVQKALTAVDLFVAPSRFLRERFIEFGVAPEKILYKDNGFDLTPFLAVRRRPRSDRRVGFAYIGTLAEHKGVHVLVEAFNHIDPALVELRVYGNPEVFPEYTARLRVLATHPGIFFVGGFDNREIGCILAEVDALVVPSLWFENSPLTIHEALLAGIPVIASDLGGMAEYVEHGRTGLLFRPGDVKDLRDQLEWFIHHPEAFAAMPRLQYAAISDHARELVEIYAGLRRRNQIPT